MFETIDIITGKVKYDIYGSLDDCSQGLYVDSQHIEDIFSSYVGERIKITIEKIGEDSH